MKKRYIVILITLLGILVLASLLNVVFVLQNRDPERYRSMIAEEVSKVKMPVDGYTPVKGIDYVDGVDGVNGQDGKDSVSTREVIIKEVPINGKDGMDGKTPTIRCNEKKNRWELSFIGDQGWTIMYGVDNLPVRCVGL